MKKQNKWEIVHNYTIKKKKYNKTVATFETDWENALILFYSVCDSYGVDSDEISVQSKQNTAFAELECESYNDTESFVLVEIKK